MSRSPSGRPHILRSPSGQPQLDRFTYLMSRSPSGLPHMLRSPSSRPQLDRFTHLMSRSPSGRPRMLRSPSCRPQLDRFTYLCRGLPCTDLNFIMLYIYLSYTRIYGRFMTTVHPSKLRTQGWRTMYCPGNGRPQHAHLDFDSINIYHKTSLSHRPRWRTFGLRWLRWRAFRPM